MYGWGLYKTSDPHKRKEESWVPRWPGEWVPADGEYNGSGQVGKYQKSEESH